MIFTYEADTFMMPYLERNGNGSLGALKQTLALGDMNSHSHRTCISFPVITALGTQPFILIENDKMIVSARLGSPVFLNACA